MELEAHTRLRIGSRFYEEDFISLFIKARNKALTTRNIESAWKKSGLLPLDPQVVLATIKDKRPKTLLDQIPNRESIAEPGVSTIKKLGITPAQAKQIDTIFEEAKKQVAQVNASVDSELLALLARAAKFACAKTALLQLTNADIMEA